MARGDPSKTLTEISESFLFATNSKIRIRKKKVLTVSEMAELALLKASLYILGLLLLKYRRRAITLRRNRAMCPIIVNCMYLKSACLFSAY